MKDLSQIRLLVLDVDGVLTDGRFAPTSNDEIKFFSVKDGLAIRLWIGCGHRLAFLSGRGSDAVQRRARDLGVEEVILGSTDKPADYRALLNRMKLEPHQTACMGDDLNDLPLLREAGFSAAPCDASQEVRDQVDHICRSAGGRGAVRETIELILRAQGKWDAIVAAYSTPR